MRYYAYYRVSSLMQEDDRQRAEISRYCNSSKIVLDGEISEKVSGGKKFQNRQLIHLLDRMSEGDCLIVADCSRLSRSMSDMSELINQVLKPRKLRLIIVSMNWDIDCCNITSVTEFLLSVISFASQMEKEMKNYQCAEGRNIRLQQLKKDGYYISKRSGQKRTHWGAKKGTDMTKAQAAASVAAIDRKLQWMGSSPAVILIKELYGQKPVKDIVEVLNQFVRAGKTEFSPRNGGEWTLNSLYPVINFLK